MRSRGTVRMAGRVQAFTLIELLVVLTIIGITAAIVVPRMRGSLRGMRVREAALTLAESIRFAQALAVDRQRTVRLRIEREPARYCLEQAKGAFSTEFEIAPVLWEAVVALPERVRFDEVRCASDSDGTKDVLLFAPDGTWSSGRIIVADETERYLVRIGDGLGRIDVVPLTELPETGAEQAYGDVLAHPL